MKEIEDGDDQSTTATDHKAERNQLTTTVGEPGNDQSMMTTDHEVDVDSRQRSVNPVDDDYVPRQRSVDPVDGAMMLRDDDRLRCR